MYIPAADMSLANPKSPTLATKLASTKIFLAAKSRWTNCERRQCIIFFAQRRSRMEWPIRKCERSSRCPEDNLQTGIACVINICLTEAHE